MFTHTRITLSSHSSHSHHTLTPPQEFKYLVKDKKELAGLEPTTLAVAAQKAAEAGHKGATPESGPWLLTLDYTTYSAVVSFADNRELRKKFYTAYRRIAADGKTDNTDIIKQILKARQETSNILGMANYAEQSFLGKVCVVCCVVRSCNSLCIAVPHVCGEQTQRVGQRLLRSGTATG